MIENKLTYTSRELLISDDELIMMIRLGDPDAMNILLNRYKPLFISISRKYERKERGLFRSDLIQNAMDAFLQSIESYRNEMGVFFAYVSVIIENSMKRSFKEWMGGNNEVIIISLDASVAPGDSMEYIDCIEDKHYSSSPKRIYFLNEQIDQLEDGFMTLTPIEKYVVFARLHNASYEEIAKKLGISVKKVDNILASARRKLRKYLKSID